MAFKFKVKKRPNLGQAVASAFSAGAVQGGTIALQNAMKEREERKQQQKALNKELKSKTDEIGQLINLVDNPETASELKKLQIIGLRYPSVEALDDAVIDTGVFNDSTLRSIGKDKFGAMIPEERYPVKQYEIGETREVKKGDDFVTEVYTMNEATGKPSWKESARAPRKVGVEKKYQAYNKTTGEVIQATESEVESNPNIAFGTEKFPATKKVLNKTTNQLEFASEEQIAKSGGNLVPTKDQPAFLSLFDQVPEAISLSSPTSVSLDKAMSNEVKLSPGTVINDITFGKLIFTGGDQTDINNYRIDAN